MEDQAALIRQACQGDADAFDALLLPYLQRIHRVAYLIAHDAHLAADAVQEALLRAYRSLGNVRPDSPFYPWLARIVVNEAIKQTRRQGRFLLPWRYQEQRSAQLPEAIVEARDEQQRLWQAVQRLTPAHRVVIVLRYYEEFSEAEMATVLAIPPGTVKSRLFHARAALERLLGGAAARSLPPAAQPVLHGGDPHD